MEWLWLILLGLGTGTFGVLVGAGGGFILAPLLLILFHMEPHVVAGTTLALVAVNSASGSVAYWRMRLTDLRSGLLFAIAGLPGAITAPFVVREVAGGTFQVLFGVLLLGLVLYMVLPRPKAAASANSAPPEARLTSRRGWLPAVNSSRHITTTRGQSYQYEFNEAVGMGFNFVLGFIASFFGIGAGFLQTPVLVYAFGFPVQVAAATSVFVISLLSIVGTGTNIFLAHIDWQAFLWAGIGLVAGGQVGARLATRFRGVWILRLLAIVVLVLGIRLIWQGLQG